MTIGEKIKQARIAHGWTQDELGQRVGVQKSAIAKWETGRVENIKREKLALLAQVLEMYPAELIGSKQEEPEASPIIKEITGILSGMSSEELAQVATYIKFIKSQGK